MPFSFSGLLVFIFPAIASSDLGELNEMSLIRLNLRLFGRLCLLDADLKIRLSARRELIQQDEYLDASGRVG
ncbi:MAG: hypothetical protein ACK59G_12420, partial [Cyanobacteriota bacterium]